MGSAPVEAADLAMLVRVVDAGSVTRVAEALYISQPAVTHRLRRLERTLGAKLMERRGRHLALTDAGRAILPLARQALQILEQIPAAISEVPAGEPTRRLVPYQGGTFTVEAFGIEGFRVEFSRTDAGAVDTLILHQPDGTVLARRIEEA